MTAQYPTIVKTGDFLKVRINLPENPEGVESENFWIEVVSVSKAIEGRVDNILLFHELLGFNYDDIIGVEPDNVICKWED